MLIYHDDLIIAGCTQEERKKLRKLLARVREFDIKFNREKMKHNCSEVWYLGHIVTHKGLKPDLKKIQVIKQCPKSKLGIQSLMGTLHFLTAYIPNIFQIAESISQLLKADAA